MPKVTYVEFNGATHTVEAPSGVSLMEGASRNGIPGIEADCGGACSCATCHVYIDEAWCDRVGIASESERSMLECAVALRDNSRLSCQIEVNDTLDGLVVTIPESQR
jgi:2Fe-2S ferredoxin